MELLGGAVAVEDRPGIVEQVAALDRIAEPLADEVIVDDRSCTAGAAARCFTQSMTASAFSCPAWWNVIESVPPSPALV